MPYADSELTSITFETGPLATKRFLLDNEEVILGTASDAMIVVPDKHLSRHHARIYSDVRGAKIEDLGSTNGTFVNGKRVRCVMLKDGDQVSLSSAVLFVFSGGVIPACTFWTRDELILILDLYFKKKPFRIPEPTDPDVVDLNNIIKKLLMYEGRHNVQDFRDPIAVHRKFRSFLRFDPSYSGTEFVVGGKIDGLIWHEYSENRTKLLDVAKCILQNIETPDLSSAREMPDIDDAIEVPEGRVLRRVHKQRERSAEIARLKKQMTLKKAGRLQCEACGFDYEQHYGERGRGFIECHHEIPLCQLLPTRKTKLSDLRLMCSNCHRMIHYGRNMLTVGELKQILERIIS